MEFELVVLNYDKEEKRQVNIWVELAKKDSLSKEKAQYLADKFLKDGTKEDIYSWLTNIFGREWVDKNDSTVYKWGGKAVEKMVKGQD